MRAVQSSTADEAVSSAQRLLVGNYSRDRMLSLTLPASAPRGTFWVLHVLHFVVPLTQSNMAEVEKAEVISLSNRRVENPWRPGWAPNFSGNALLRAT